MGSVVSPALIVRHGNTPWGAFGMGELQFLLCALNLIVIPLECGGLSGVFFFFSHEGEKNWKEEAQEILAPNQFSTFWTLSDELAGSCLTKESGREKNEQAGGEVICLRSASSAWWNGPFFISRLVFACSGCSFDKLLRGFVHVLNVLH